MFKLKDVFKVAVVGTAGYFGGKIAGPTGKKIGAAFGESLMSRGSGGSTLPASAQFARSGINLSQFGMPTYAAGRATSDMIPGSLKVVDGMPINSLWENRLNKYLLRRKALSEKTVVKV